MSDTFDLGTIFGAAADAETTRQHMETIDRLTRRVRELETRAQRLRDLASDPAQSHRMISRREILRTLDGRNA